MVEQTDSAYRYVIAANRKEEANRRARERDAKPSWPLCLVAALLLTYVAVQHWQDSRPFFAALFGMIATMNAGIAYSVWRKR